MKTPRGIRNNNPLNIRRGQSWRGLRPKQTDSEFCQFITMAWGIRAACRILRTYRRRGWVTVTQIIEHWAPQTENNTTAYIKYVCLRNKWPEHRCILDSDFIPLLTAMAAVECNNYPIDPSIFIEGYDKYKIY